MSVELCSNSCTTIGIVDCIRFYLLLRLSPFMRLRSFLFLCPVASSIHLHEEIHATIDLSTACVHFWVYGNFQACKHYDFGCMEISKHANTRAYTFGCMEISKHANTRAYTFGCMEISKHANTTAYTFGCMEISKHANTTAYTFGCMEISKHANTTAYTFGCMEISKHANTTA